MMKRLLSAIVIGILLIGTCWGTDATSLFTLFKSTEAFFRNVKGRIVHRTDIGTAIINIGSADGIVLKMRLRVLKPSVPFRHPVTGEIVGTTDEPVGYVEVIKVSEDKAIVRLIEGKMAVGYKVATPSEPFRVLFHQDTGVDYYWADQYHKKLSKIKNISLIDAPIEDYSTEELYKLADEKEADMILTLSGYIERDKMIITQRLLWADGVTISTKTVKVSLQEVKKLQIRAGQAILSMDQPLLIFTLPIDAKMITFGDVNGDSLKELAVATDTDIYLYRLYPAELQELGEFELPNSRALIWFDAIDIDNDGKDELSYTIFDDVHEKPISYIAKISNFKKGKIAIKLLWTAEGFLRRFRDKLLYQEYTPSKIWGKKIHILQIIKEKIIKLPFEAQLPKGIDIYGFSFLYDDEGRIYYVIVDKRGFVRLYDKNGKQFLPKRIQIGGFDRSIKLYEDPFTEETKYWYIKDRIITLGYQVLLIKRTPLSAVAPGLGYKSSNIVSIWIAKTGLKSNPLLQELSGSIRDFYLGKERLYVLQSPMLGFSLKGLLSGKGINTTKLLVYQKRLKQ